MRKAGKCHRPYHTRVGLVTRPLVEGGRHRSAVHSMADAPDPGINRIWLNRHSGGVGVVALLLAKTGKVVERVVVLRETV